MPSRTYVAEFIDPYLDDELPTVRQMAKSGIKSYELSLVLFMEFASKSLCKRTSKILVSDLTYDLVYEFMIENKRKRNWSPATWNARLSGIRSFIRYLAGQDLRLLTLENRVEKISCQKISIKDPFYLNSDTVQKVLDNMAPKKWIELRDLTMLQVMYATGMRVAEVCSLKTKQLIWISSKTIHIHFKAKGRKKRALPLIDSKTIRNIEKLQSLTEGNSKYLFPTRDGTKMSTDNARARTFKVFKEQSSKKNKVTPHVLRRSFAMKLLSQSGDLEGVSAMLGHNQITTTQKYTRSNLEDREAELRRIGMAGKDNKPFAMEPAKDAILERIRARSRNSRNKQFRTD